ncbi:PH-like domain-containing protein [Actinopolyspora mortivallis]|uniref:Transporter n=1 Tax=Actinopolyspora mortivallis TaxID=33906 RepID=A0A2T0H1D2_ACTMO|nr:transporter [Actinopolyspora mortivallis]PRW65188.1 transporter [Actinopolyspora mortivallis]
MTRTLWVLALALAALVVLYAMRRGWTNRAARHADLPALLPGVPEGLSEEDELLPSVAGLYVGTTVAGDWQDRVSAGTLGHRAGARLRLHRTGLLVERAGSEPLWIPTSALRDARVDHKLANKVVPGVGMLVVTWKLGDHLLDSGFRPEGAQDPHQWVRALHALVPAETPDSPSEHDDEAAMSRQEET